MMQVDLQSSFLLGSGMAIVARRRLRTADAAWLARTHAVVLAVGGAVFAPVWLYITLRWTGWETMYRWDLATIPPWLVAAFLPAISLAALLGFRITAALIRAERVALALALDALLAASCAAIVALGWQRVIVVGTMAERRAGTAGRFLGSELAATLAVATVLIVAPVAVLVVRWLREGEA